MTSMPANKDDPRISRSINDCDDNLSSNSGNTNFPDDVWMDDKEVSSPNSFLGKIFPQKNESVEDVFNVVSNRAMLETEVWKTQMAIYDELIAASVTEREEKIKRTTKYEELIKENEQLKRIKCENEAQIEKLIKENTELKKNICSLYKTAKSESDRKDKMMLEINEELDSLRHEIKRKRRENNHYNWHDARSNGNLKNHTTLSKAVQVELTSFVLKPESNPVDKHNSKGNKDSRYDKLCSKTVDSRKVNPKDQKSTSHQSSNKSRDEVNKSVDSRKRKRESSYRSPCKYRYSYRDGQKRTRRSSHSFYKKSYGYPGISPRKKPRKSADLKEIMKYNKSFRSPSINAKSRVFKTESRNSKGIVKKIDFSRDIGKVSANGTDCDEKEGKMGDQKISDKKKAIVSERNADAKIACSNNDDAYADSKKVADPSSPGLLLREEKIITDTVESLLQIPNLKLPSALTSTATATANIPSAALAVTAEGSVPTETYATKDSQHQKTIQPKASEILDGKMMALSESVPDKVSALPESVIAKVSESVVAEVSAPSDNIAAKGSAPNLPVAIEVPFTDGNSTKSKDTVLLQNVDTVISSNNDLESIEQNVSSASSNSELVNNAEGNLNSENKCLDILDDKTTTNALFFGLLPIEIRRSFMEYEQQHIVNTNRLKQSFVNYYFRHYQGGIGPSTHNDEVTANREALKNQCSGNQTTSQTKDISSPLFFFDEKNKMAMSMNSDVSPKTLSVDETSRTDPIMSNLASKASDKAMPTDCLLLKTKGVSSEMEDEHSDSTKEIDVFQLDVIQRQLNKNNDKTKDLSQAFTFEPSPVTVTADAPTMHLSIAYGVTTLPVPVSVKIPTSSVSDAVEETVPPLSVAVEMQESSAAFVANVPSLSTPILAEASPSSVSVAAEIRTLPPSTADLPASIESVAKVSVLPVDDVPVTASNSLNGDSSVTKVNEELHASNVWQKSPPELQICYIEASKESYPPSFNSVYYRRQLVKTALREQEEEGLSKSTKEDLEKLYRFKKSKKPLVIRKKTKHKKET